MRPLLDLKIFQATYDLIVLVKNISLFLINIGSIRKKDKNRIVVLRHNIFHDISTFSFLKKRSELHNRYNTYMADI